MPEKTERGTVLVVDDDTTILDFIDMVLSFEGLRCLVANNGLEAQQLVEKENPSLIIVDISMPVMDGLEFCRWLRSTDHADTPVIVMTAGRNAARACREAEAQDYLAKPFELRDLQSCIRKWAEAL